MWVVVQKKIKDVVQVEEDSIYNKQTHKSIVKQVALVSLFDVQT